jgi:hypothetical protein
MAICAFLGELAILVTLPKADGFEISVPPLPKTTRLNVLNVSSRGSRARRSLMRGILCQAQVFVHVEEPEDVGQILAAGHEGPRRRQRECRDIQVAIGRRIKVTRPTGFLVPCGYRRANEDGLRPPPALKGSSPNASTATSALLELCSVFRIGAAASTLTV